MTYMDPFPKGTRISQEFRASPGGYNPRGGHTGRDYAVRSGTPVRAAADGIIRNSGWLTDNYAANPWWLTRYGGDTLVLDCTDAFGRTDTMPTFVYAHLLESTAPVGARVKKGQIIGISGNSGTATSGDHCHVERLNPGFDLKNDVYGRSPLGFDEYYTGLSAQGSTTKEDDDMPTAAEVADEIFNRKIPSAGNPGKTLTLSDMVMWYDANNAAIPVNTVKELLKRPVDRRGEGMTGTLTLEDLIGWYDANNVAIATNAGNAQVANLIGAIGALSKGEAFDEAKLLAGVQAATAAGLKDALQSVTTTITVKGA